MSDQPRTPLSAILNFFRVHKELTGILLTSLLVYAILGGVHSYWLDEVYSVKLYGIDHPDVGAALRFLGETSIHPPLYQAILFLWMKLFGHTEAATRALSSLYIAGSILFLYVFVLHTLGRKMAITATMLFAFCYSTALYGLETRSYAQTLFFTMASSCALFYYLKSLHDDFSVRSLFLNRYFYLFTLANIGLLLTHYYNIFFLVPQGLFLLLWLLWRNPKQNIFLALFKSLVPYAITLGTFALLWGGYFLSRSSIRREAYIPEELTSPIFVFLAATFVVNITPQVLIYILVVVAFLLILINNIKTLRHKSEFFDFAPYIYVSLALIGPFIFSYIVFSLIDFERLHARYYIYTVPFLMIVISITIHHAILFSERFFRRFGKFSFEGFYNKNPFVIALIATFTLTLSGYLSGIQGDHYIWREITQQIVDVTDAYPDQDYFIIETTFRPENTLDYYLQRFNPSLKTQATLLWAQDANIAKNALFTDDESVLTNHDFIVLVFTHHMAQDFPRTLDFLANQYELHHVQLNNIGHGFVIYRIHPS